MHLAFAFQYPGLKGGKREKAPQRESSWAWVQSLCGPCLHLLAGDLVPVGSREAPKGSEQGQPSPGLLFVIPGPDWSGLCSGCFTAFPEGSWSPCVWNPLIRGWGGGWGEPLALGSSGDNQLGASAWSQQPGPAWSQCPSQAQPWCPHRQIFVVGLVTGPKQLARGPGGVLEGDSTTE